MKKTILTIVFSGVLLFANESRLSAESNSELQVSEEVIELPLREYTTDEASEKDQKELSEKIEDDNSELIEKNKNLQEEIEKIEDKYKELLSDKEDLENQKQTLVSKVDSVNHKYNELEKLYKKSQESFFSWMGLLKTIGLLWVLFLFFFFIRKKFMS